MKNNKGFTLVELLATIAILAVIGSITIYIALSVVKSAKEKTYETTKANVTSNVSSYLLERGRELSFVKTSDGLIEYQCVLVKNLVDLGYLDNKVMDAKVSEDRTVMLDDYIYVERDTTTKAITKSIYIVDNNSTYGNVCGAVERLAGVIEFSSNPAVDTWSQSKEITIMYRITNINDINTFGDYQYTYVFRDEEYNQVASDSKTFNDYYMTNGFIASVKGSVNAKIVRSDGVTVATGTHPISNIDRTGPVVNITNPTGNLYTKATIVINVSDTQSGVNYNSFTQDDIEVSIGGTGITTFTLTKKDNNGNYNLTIEDTEHYGEVIITIKANSILDNVGNKNGGDSFPLSAEWRKAVQTSSVACANSTPTYNGTAQTIVSTAGVGYTWVSGATRTNAGSQDATASLSTGYIWSDGTVDGKTINCSVNPKSVAVSWGDTTSFVYNGSGQAPTASVTTGVTGESMTVTRTTAKNVGSNYTSTASCSSVTGGQASCSNYTLTSTTKAFSITRASIDLPTCIDKTYSGSEQTLFAAHTSGEYTNSVLKGTNAGTYTVSLTPTGNYKWSDGTTAAKNVSCKINKKSIAVSWGTTTSFVYNGSAQAPTASATTGVTGESMTVSRTTATNVGSNYTSTASCSSVTGGQASCSNYTLTSKTKTFSITRASINLPTCSAKTYNGSEQTLFAAHTSGEYTNSVLKGTNAGTYTVSLTPTGNYKWSDGSTTAKDVSCEINKKSLAVSAWSTDYVANSTNYKRNSYSTGIGSETITLTYKPYSNTAGEYTYSTSAGSGKFTLSLSSSNYSISSAGKFTINGKKECWYSQGYSNGCFAEPIKTSTKKWTFSTEMYLTIDAKVENDNKPDGCEYDYPNGQGGTVHVNVCNTGHETSENTARKWFHVEDKDCWVWGGFFTHTGSEDSTTGACRAVAGGNCSQQFTFGNKTATCTGSPNRDTYDGVCHIICVDVTCTYNDGSGSFAWSEMDGGNC